MVFVYDFDSYRLFREKVIRDIEMELVLVQFAFNSRFISGVPC